MRRWVCSLVFLMVATQAHAGAWTLHADHSQIITTFTTSSANESFGNAGRADQPTRFSKTFMQASLEFGLTSNITLLLAPSYVIADVATPTTSPLHANNTSFEGGARVLLFGHDGKLAVQATYKTAGAFDLSVSANHESGSQIDLRVLYGTNFKLFGDNGFFDVEAGERFINHPRPNEPRSS